MHLFDFISQREPTNGGIRQDQLDRWMKALLGSLPNVVALKKPGKKPCNFVRWARAFPPGWGTIFPMEHPHIVSMLLRK